ncbi:MAG TPA: twin-arginine translocase TatA/TatE family subunit [Nitrospiraceae bacterium]|nr:twin-arginine translocase TatA/TatE family subunit [Nitrospiraceae bacterium]
MFGTLGFSELIIILVIVLIIFGAGRLPQLGEGLGKALKGFKKEVHEVPPVEPNTAEPPPVPIEHAQTTGPLSSSSAPLAENLKPTAPYQPGPELTPGTTAALMASAAPQVAPPPRTKPTPSVSTPGPTAPSSAQLSQPPTMEDRMTAPAPVLQASYPPLPASAQAKPAAKRPSAIVNKDAVARVQAQQAAMKTNAAQKQAKPAQDTGLSPKDMQNLGESLGDTLRTFRQAAADVRNAVDPEMRTIRAEMDAAQKEIEQSIEAAKQLPAASEEPSKQG